MPSIAPNSLARNGLVELLQRGIVSGSDADDLFHRLEAAFGASGVIVGQHVSFDAWNATANVPAEWIEDHRKYQDEDPCAEMLTARPPGTFYLLDADLAQKTDFSRPNCVEHVYPAFRRSGLRDGAVCRLYSPFLDDLFFVLYRREGSPVFSEAERKELESLNPLLAGALATRRAVAALGAAPGETRADVLRRVRAYAHVSWPGGCVEWSEGGRELWRRCYGRISARGWRRLERAVGRAALRFCTAGPGGRSQILVAGIRAEFAFVEPDGGDRCRMLVLFVEEGAIDGAPAPAEELLAPRELEVARSAARGDSVAQIAGALGVTDETIRSCLKAVYGKLRVTNRVELALLLAGSSHR